MYRDKVRWTIVRNRVLIDGLSRRQVMREEKISYATMQKMLTHSS